MARHFNTLCLLITGIVKGQTSQLSRAAVNAPSKIKTASLVKKFERWVQNQSVNADRFFLPFITQIIALLSLDTYYIIFDGSVVGRDCVTLMASFVYKGRAIPLTWITINGKKGHFPEELHIQLLAQVRELLPVASDVIIIGDGEFDGVNFLREIEANQWGYVVRAAHNAVLLTSDNEKINFNELNPTRGGSTIEHDVAFTSKEYEIESAVVWWRTDCKQAIYLISNIYDKAEILMIYTKRFATETLFSDKKSKGFNVHKSHLSIVARINSLLIATSIAYIWIVYLGVYCINSRMYETIHRKNRCDFSLFQLGYRLLQYLLTNSLKIPTKITFSNVPI